MGLLKVDYNSFMHSEPFLPKTVVHAVLDRADPDIYNVLYTHLSVQQQFCGIPSQKLTKNKNSTNLRISTSKLLQNSIKIFY